MANAKLGLVGLQKGLEAIPDEAWEIFPPFRPPPGYRAKDRRKQQQQQQQNSGSQQDSGYTSSRQQRDSQDSGYYDQNYPQQQQQQPQQQQPYYDQRSRSQSSGGQPGQPYHPPEDGGNSGFAYQGDPRFNPGQQQQQQQQQYYQNNAYDPQGGGARGFDPNVPYQNPPYSPPQNPPYSPPGMSQYQPPQQGYNRPYNPSNYTPQQDDYYSGGGGGGYGQNLNAPSRYPGDPYARPVSASGYRSGDRPYAQDDYDDERDRGRRGDKKSKHHDYDMSPSPTDGLRGQVHKHFDQSERGLVSGGVGAVAGGFLGHHFGKGPLATVAGAFIGGLGANAWEAQQTRRKEEKALRRRAHSEGRRGTSSRYDDYRSSGSRDYDDRRGAPEPRGYLRDDERDHDRDRRESSRGRGEYDEDEDYDDDSRYAHDRRRSSHSRR